MQRWLVILLIVLALLLLLSPGIIGRFAERNIDESLTRIDLEYEDIAIEAESFRRGWFTSEGRHRVLLQGGALLEIADDHADRVASTPALIIETRVDHGLVPLSSLQREGGSLNPALATAVSTVALDRGDGDPIELPGQVYAFIGLGGDTSFRYIAEPGSAVSGNTMTDWQDADITFTQSADGLRRSLQGDIGPAGFESFGVKTSFGRISVDLAQDRREHLLGEGEFDLEIASLAVRSPGEPDLEIGPVSVAAVNRLDDGRTSGDGRLSLQIADLAGLGPATMAADIGVEGLDADALYTMLAAYRTLNQIGAPASEAELMAVYPALERSAQALAARGGRIRIGNARASLPLGEWQMELSVDVSENQSPASAFSWPSVLLAASAELDLRISPELFDYLVDQNPRFRGALASGMLRRSGDDYVMQAELDGGRLLINGAPMNLPAGLPR